MREIKKNNEPPSFADWNKKRNADWEPSYDVLQNPEKRDLQIALMAEQGNTCCYCGRKITISTSHIEHFIPQELREDLALEYSNLHASCIREKNPGMPLHCGHAKENKYCAQYSISPLENGCASRFLYVRQTGTVVSNSLSDASAKYMIETLSLNVASLEASRAAALKLVFDDALELSVDELEKLAVSYRKMDDSNSFEDFGHVLARYAEQQIAEIWKRRKP